jgi:hypothetical protein
MSTLRVVVCVRLFATRRRTIVISRWLHFLRSDLPGIPCNIGDKSVTAIKQLISGFVSIHYASRSSLVLFDLPLNGLHPILIGLGRIRKILRSSFV